MHHASIHFVDAIVDLQSQGQHFDLIVTTDMLNVAELKGLLTSHGISIPVVLYFHENQFFYPKNPDAASTNTLPDRDHHYAFINLISALAADRCVFNSHHNLRSFSDTAVDMCGRWPDFPPRKSIDQILDKSTILFPGIEFPPHLQLPTTGKIDFANSAISSTPAASKSMHLVWAARWEHDKNPTRLLKILRGLKTLGCDFQLSLLGESYTRKPIEFEAIADEFAGQILRLGYLQSRHEYLQTLAEADVFLSTADHEFFGLSAVEAVCLGTSVVLPNRLAYPEIRRHVETNLGSAAAEKIHLYESDEMAIDMLRSLASITSIDSNQAFASRYALFGWPSIVSQYDHLLTSLIDAPAGSATNNGEQVTD
jgi:glycosyltransferase involved in cell wall biosynthesis